MKTDLPGAAEATQREEKGAVAHMFQAQWKYVNDNTIMLAAQLVVVVVVVVVVGGCDRPHGPAPGRRVPRGARTPDGPPRPLRNRPTQAR